ncbi:MAG: BON domain-containing protein [Planctomycetota bacterium]
MVRNDEQIKKDIVDELYWNTRVDASDVNVEVDAGKAALTGTVPTYLAREEAFLSARRIAGVVGVDNQVRVEYPTTFSVPTDAEVQQNAMNAVQWSPELDDTDIQVSVATGKVSLEGTVDALWKKYHAEALVSNLAGVLSIENKLTVVPTEEVADKATAEDIMGAIERRLGTYAPNITVQVRNGVVTLTGTVPTWRERQEAYEAALYTFGVLEVDNQIALTTAPAGVTTP